MNAPILGLCLVNLALIGALPRIFFRPGRLNLQWWITAGPFFTMAGLLIAALFGSLSGPLPPSDARAFLAATLCASSILLIGFTLGTHREPVSLWQQEDDAPMRLVTHGAYARIRHPFYTAFLLALLGATLALPHPLAAIVFLFACVQLNRTAAREEARLLRSTFGREYAGYLSATGRFLPLV
jgi:protein-S-isoprenylcysteine O-methyltransferase Ste14